MDERLHFPLAYIANFCRMPRGPRARGLRTDHREGGGGGSKPTPNSPCTPRTRHTQDPVCGTNLKYR